MQTRKLEFFGHILVGEATGERRQEVPLLGQLFLWALLSMSFTVMWFKYLKPKASKAHAGQAKEGIVGETGTISRGTEDSNGRGTVRFSIAVLGTDEWGCYADEVLQVGDSVRVVESEGQILKVIKIQCSDRK